MIRKSLKKKLKNNNIKNKLGLGAEHRHVLAAFTYLGSSLGLFIF
jgi:hypothetical protein